MAVAYLVCGCSGRSGWGNWWGAYAGLGFEALLGKVKSQLNSSGVMEDSTIAEELPRLNLYNNTVLGPCMTRSEEIALKQHLQHVLRQVQYSMKLIGLQPVELHDVEIVRCSPSRPRTITGVQPSFHRGSGMYHAFEAVFPSGELRPGWESWKGRYSPRNLAPRSNSRNLEAELELKELQNANLVEAYEKFSAQYKSFITASLDNQHVTPEFAQELQCIVECYNKNVERALNSGGYLLSLKCLLGRIAMFDSLSSLSDSAKMYGSLALFVLTVIDGAAQCIGTSPIQFKSIGKKARSILDLDFTFDKLRLNCDPYKKVSFGVGGQFGGQQTVRELMVKCKDDNNSISINLKSVSDNIAPDGGVNAPAVLNDDIAITRVSVDKLFGAETKCVTRMSFPSLNFKFDVRHRVPYAAFAGGVELLPNPAGGGPIPVLDASVVGGMKCAAFGLHFQLREGLPSTTLGASVTTDLLALGFTYKFPGTCNATFWKKIIDSSTTIAAQAGYKPQPAENAGPPADGVNPGFRLTLGVKHALDPTLYCKARVGTDGGSFMVKKSTSDGRFTIKGALHVDFEHPERVPKMGVVCSFRS